MRYAQKGHHMQHRAIETRYKGYRFRSRLEGRWAVFFDALGLSWEYEPEGFELDGGVRYLPDFRLTVFGCVPVYVEVKPPAPIPKAEVEKLYAFGQFITSSCENVGFIIVKGDPVHADALMTGSFGGARALGVLSFEDYVTAWQLFSRKSRSAVEAAAFAAREARFEHGERGVKHG